MLKPEDFRDRPNLHARAEPDDEYYWRPQPRDPHQIDPDSYDEDEEEEEQDEHDA